MTPFQFEQIETAHKRMLRLEREGLALNAQAPKKRSPLPAPAYYEIQLEEMDHIIGKFQKVGEDQRLPVEESSSISSSSVYEFEIGQDLMDDTFEVPDLKELGFKKQVPKKRSQKKLAERTLYDDENMIRSRTQGDADPRIGMDRYHNFACAISPVVNHR